jgi:hypothetical protein
MQSMQACQAGIGAEWLAVAQPPSGWAPCGVRLSSGAAVLVLTSVLVCRLRWSNQQPLCPAVRHCLVGTCCAACDMGRRIGLAPP